MNNILSLARETGKTMVAAISDSNVIKLKQVFR